MWTNDRVKTSVRKLLSASIIALSCVSAAQTAEELAVSDGLKQLATSATLQVNLVGKEWIGSNAKDITAQGNFWNTFRPDGLEVRMAEVVEFEGAILTQRVVGDGITLYSFNPRRNEYTTSVYGSFDGVPTGYTAKLNTGLATQIKGHASSIVRIVSDIHSARMNTSYRSWTPGFAPRTIDTAPEADPLVPARQYTPTPATYYVQFSLRQPLRKVITFELNRSDNAILNMYFAAVSSMGSKTKLVDWTMTFRTGLSFTRAEFQFVPPTTAKAITGPDLSKIGG
jgi:hypothetical protein